ncbi:MAG: hypothetical protein JXM70_13470 [Pirellulales bacterium]|nr:hypothetical protein [Pirellulales bacterium]
MIEGVLDAGVIILLVQLVNQGDTVEWGTAIMCAVVISLGFLALSFVPFPWILICLPFMAVVAGLAIAIGCGTPVKRAMIAGGLFLVWKIACVFVVVFMLR